MIKSKNDKTSPLDPSGSDVEDNQSNSSHSSNQMAKLPLDQEDSDATLRGSCASSCPVRKMVRFEEAETVVPPPTEPLTPTERRAVFYTGKELQVMKQRDLDSYNEYLIHHKSRRHSHWPSSWGTHNHNNNHNMPSIPETDLPRRTSAPAEANNHRGTHSSDWRGLENFETRPAHVQKIVQEIVDSHKQLKAHGLPALNDELRKASKERTRSDRQRAEQLGLKDAKEALGKMEAVRDLITLKHSTRNSPARQMRKVGVLVTGAISA